MISLPLKQMTQAEKLMALEAIWDDLSRNEETFESPAWHKEELAATEERVRRARNSLLIGNRRKRSCAISLNKDSHPAFGIERPCQSSMSARAMALAHTS